MLRLTSALTAIGFAAASLASTAADAATKHRVHHPIHAAAASHRAAAPVGVTASRAGVEMNQRSFLDPGPAPQLNDRDGAHYVQAVTTLSRTPDQAFNSHFGNETLPRPFEIPTDQGPLVEFWTPAFR